MVRFGECCAVCHRNLCSHLFRQEFPASGRTTATVFSQNTSTRFVTPLLRYTIPPSRFALPHLGFASAMALSSHEKLRLSGGSQLNGEIVPVRFRSAAPHWPSHAGETSSRLVRGLVTSPSSMQSRAAMQQSFLRTLIGWDLSLSQQMGHSLYLEATIELSNSGMSRPAGLQNPSTATPFRFVPSPFHQTVPRSPRDPWITRSACGTFKRGSVVAS